MPIPSTIADLSTVAADNSPQGSEPIGTSLDNYIRSGFAFVRQLSNTKANLSGALFTGAFGYGPGAGGTVIQATSKSTAVTLHKPCGQIRINAESLAAGATIGFNVTNSLIASTDTVLLTQSGVGGQATSYEVWASAGNGVFNVYLRNITAGALAEAVVINFSIHKGATS